MNAQEEHQMNDEINYKNNPLHGVGVKKMLTELSEHYGFEILYAYLTINCFKSNPSVASSVKFLKKTDWAREKVEAFYLYKFKNLPKVSHDQYELSPRDRIIPEDQTPGEPAVLSLEDAERVREKRELKSAEYEAASGVGKDANNDRGRGRSEHRDNKHNDKDSRKSSKPSNRVASTADNPWGIRKD